MKKLIALVLAIVLTLSLTACGGPELLGTYKIEVDLTETIASWFDGDFASQMVDVEALDLSLTNYMDAFMMTVYTEFKEDGTYIQTLDPESILAAAEQLKPALYIYAEDIAREYTISIFSSLFTIETEEDLERMIGTTWAEYYDTNLRAALEPAIEKTLNVYISSLTETYVLGDGIFKAKNGKLYLADLGGAIDEEAYETYEIDGDTVTVTGCVNTEETTLLPYPYIMTKVSE